MSLPQKEDSFLQRILKSKWLAWMVNLPGISWIVARSTREMLADELVTNRPEAGSYFTDAPGTEASVPFKIPVGEHARLHHIVATVVNDLGYVGAFLALYEQGDVLPIHAYYLRYDLISHERILELEEQISKIMNQKMSLSDPSVARVELYNEDHANNLSIRAVKSGQPVIDKELFSLFTPIVPDISRPIFKGIQEGLGIQEVVAVPFTIDYYSTVNDESKPERPTESGAIQFTREIVGNLFAVSTEKITPQKINVLRAFGYQAAAAIQNSHYKKQSAITQRLISHLQHTIQTEQQTFDEVVKVIVKELNYIGAMISISDTQNTLHIKAYRMAREAYSDKPVVEWQQMLSGMSGLEINLAKPDFIDLDLNDTENDGNLAYKVMESQQIMTTTSMYSLFRPMLPVETREKVEEIQSAMGVQSILAIPLFSYEPAQRVQDNNCVGVLFVASRSRGFTSQEVDMLKTVGEQVGNAMVYSLSEKRRQASERFARMAFNANALLHDINGHIGAIGMALRFLNLPEDEEGGEPYAEFLGMAKDRITVAADLLQQLSEPFIDRPETETNLMQCIGRAIEKLDLELKSYQITVNLQTENDIPEIIGFREMLVQVFRIIIKRAMNAISSMDKRDGKIDLVVEHFPDSQTILVSISDNGRAMTADELSAVFDIHENQQDTLVGFGLFWANDYLLGMGGKITVESQTGKGTTIEVRIPVRQQALETQEEGN